MAVDPRLHGYSPERITQFMNTLRLRVAALPGVSSATYTDSIPLSGGNRSDSFQAVSQPTPARSDVNVELYMAGPDYFQTIGTPILAGRDFMNESATGPRVAIVNQAFAERLSRMQTRSDSASQAGALPIKSWVSPRTSSRAFSVRISGRSFIARWRRILGPTHPLRGTDSGAV